MSTFIIVYLLVGIITLCIAVLTGLFSIEDVPFNIGGIITIMILVVLVPGIVLLGLLKGISIVILKCKRE